VLQITNNDPPVGRQATRVPAIMPAIVEIAKAADTPDEIAARIRTAHQNVVTSFRNAIKYALQASEALSAAKADKAVPHGQWGDFLRKCDIGDRTARRYMQRAELAKRSPTTVLDGISIEAAIKKLLSPKDGTAPSPKAKPRPSRTFDFWKSGWPQRPPIASERPTASAPMLGWMQFRTVGSGYLNGVSRSAVGQHCGQRCR
jgi:hypothetical protein